MVDTVHIDALLTAGLRLHRRSERPLTWFWPALDAASDRGDVSSTELTRQAHERQRHLTRDTAGLVGAMLLAENRRSVDHRYDEAEWEPPYLFTELDGEPRPVTVLKLINGYTYQACEHPQWRASEAKAFCEALQAKAITCLSGYDQAPFATDDPRIFTLPIQS